MKRIIVMASGRGSNFRAVLEWLSQHPGQAAVTTLVTDRPDTGAELLARENKIEVMRFDYSQKEFRAQTERKLTEAMVALNPDLILALGFMKILPPDLVRAFPHRILNVHPSLLPAFPGMNAQKQALDYGVRITGATVHFVDVGVDTGPIILQGCVEIPERSTHEELSALIRTQEHALVARALELFLSGQIQVDGRNVRTKSRGQS